MGVLFLAFDLKPADRLGGDGELREGSQTTDLLSARLGGRAAKERLCLRILWASSKLKEGAAANILNM